MSIIPEATIEEVRALTDIVEVVSDYVKLKRRGSNFVGLCPFHSEKTPSFNVNPSLNIFKCFGCGEGGDAFRFLERTEGLSFPESVRLLAERAGVTLPEEDAPGEDASESEAIYHALRFAARFFHENLARTEQAQGARTYLKERGFSSDSVKTFGVGYAPDAWDALLKEGEKAHIKPDILEAAGLVVPRKDGSGHYDRYRHRLIFPIFSHVGKVLGFGGRILRPDDEPKYINSPETKVYSKSRVLYGLYHGKNAMRSREEVVLVEGYTDVMALYQADVQHVVASSGTALTEEQVAILGRYVKTVVLLYDADSAGLRAALRGIDLILTAGLIPYAVQLPEGDDPDSFVREHGGRAFDTYLKENRQHFIDFVLRNAKAAGRMDSPEGQAAVQRTVLQSLSLIPDALVRESYLKEASDRLGIPDMQLRPVLADLMKKGSRQRRTPRPAAPAPVAPVPDAASRTAVTLSGPKPVPEAQTEPSPAEKFLHFLMLNSGLPMIEYIMGHMAVEEFTPGSSRELAAELVSQFNAGRMDRNRFTGGGAGRAVQDLVAEVLTHALEPSHNWQRLHKIAVPRLGDDPQDAAASAMVLMKLRHADQQLEAVSANLYRAQQSGEDARALLELRMRLLAHRRAIQEREFLDQD